MINTITKVSGGVIASVVITMAIVWALLEVTWRGEQAFENRVIQRMILLEGRITNHRLSLEDSIDKAVNRQDDRIDRLMLQLIEAHVIDEEIGETNHE